MVFRFPSRRGWFRFFMYLWPRYARVYVYFFAWELNDNEHVSSIILVPNLSQLGFSLYTGTVCIGNSDDGLFYIFEKRFVPYIRVINDSRNVYLFINKLFIIVLSLKVNYYRNVFIYYIWRLFPDCLKIIVYCKLYDKFCNNCNFCQIQQTNVSSDIVTKTFVYLMEIWLSGYINKLAQQKSIVSTPL